MSKVSVVIPVYKSEKNLSICLDSVISQTFSNLEIICVNDGSPDNCMDILTRYKKNDMRIIIIDQNHAGQSEARNAGIEKSTGEYLFFVDSDDRVHPRAIEILLDVAEKTNAPITVSNFFIKSSKKQNFENIKDGDPVDYTIHKDALPDMLYQRYLSSLVWNKLFKKDVFKGHKFISGIEFEDWPLITCMFSEISFYVSVNKSLYFYNDVDESIVRSPFTIKKINDYMIGINFVYNYYQQPDKIKYWRLVQKKRIKQSMKMVLSKVIHSKDNKADLAQLFFKELKKLREKHIFLIWDFSIKSKWRLLRLLLYIKCRGKK